MIGKTVRKGPRNVDDAKILATGAESVLVIGGTYSDRGFARSGLADRRGINATATEVNVAEFVPADQWVKFAAKVRTLLLGHQDHVAVNRLPTSHSLRMTWLNMVC